MSDQSPKTLWDRVLRAFEGWIEPADDGDVDEGLIAFHLLFLAPVFLAFVMLVRRWT